MKNKILTWGKIITPPPPKPLKAKWSVPNQIQPCHIFVPVLIGITYIYIHLCPSFDVINCIFDAFLRCSNNE